MKTYLRHRIVNLVDVKELLAMEYLDFLGKYAKYSERHAFWEICYAERGNVTCRIAEKSYDLQEGTILFVPPNAEHSYHSEAGNETRTFVVCFECFSPALKILGEKKLTLSSEQLHMLQIIIRETAKTFRMNERDQMEAIDRSELGGQQVILLQLEYLIISVLRAISSDADADVVFLREKNFYENLIKIITDYFAEHISEPLTLDKICRKVNYSRSFLCKIFKKYTGESLFTYFNRLKITEAKRLLEETDLPAAKIARLIGLNDAKYFNTLFKKHTGKTPIRYRADRAERRKPVK